MAVACDEHVEREWHRLRVREGLVREREREKEREREREREIGEWEAGEKESER